MTRVNLVLTHLKFKRTFELKWVLLRARLGVTVYRRWVMARVECSSLDFGVADLWSCDG